MKRHKSLIELSRQHHDALILAQLIKKGAPVYRDMPTDTEGKRKYTIHMYENDLTKHFEIEEQIVIPSVRGYRSEIDDLCNEIIEDHKKIKNYVELLSENKDAEKNLDELGFLIESHVRKEEGNLFNKIQDELSETELDEIELSINNFMKK